MYALWSVTLFRPLLQLPCSVYWRAAFISVDLAVGEAFIGGQDLLEGGV